MVKGRTSIRSSLRPHKSECGRSGCQCERCAETQGQVAELQYRYNLIKDFLTRVLDVEEVVAERDAFHLQHILSIRTVQKMAAFYQHGNTNCNIKS